MAEVKWIKVYTDMFAGSRKMKLIEAMPEGDAIVVIWLKLLLLAGDINDGGSIYVTPDFPYTDETLATQLNKPLPTVRLACSVLEKFGMIVTNEDGYLAIKNWEEYQSADKLAELRAKDRERKRLKKAKTSAVLPESPNSTEIPRKFHGNSTDVPHIEEEEEKDLDKESHSFNLSREEEKLKMLGGTLGGGVVMLSDEQFDSLCEELSFEELNKYIGAVRDCELAGKHYKKKTHYQAILDMAKKDRKIKGGKDDG